MRAIFIRHGESTGNVGIPCDDVSQILLTPAGHAQAALVAAGWTEAPALIVVSPYVRTQLTALPTQSRFPHVPVEVLPVQEFTYLEPSRWNGTSPAARLASIEAYWRAADPLYQDGPGAESFSHLLHRVQVTLARLEKLSSDSLVFAFSHGLFMQAVRISLMHPQWSEQQAMDHFWRYHAQSPIPNTGVVVTRYQHGHWALASA